MLTSKKITIYSPESGIKNPVQLCADMIADLKEAHSLGIRLAKRNVKAMYRQSMLGYVWSVIPPLITSFVWVFLNAQSVVNIAVTDVPYPLFVLTGTMLWQIFAESVNAPLRGVTSGRSMLAKINFPRESLILSSIYEVFFNTLIKLGLIIAIFAYYQYLPGFQALFALLGVLALTLLGCTIGLVLTPLGVLYNDINRGITVVLQFAIYLTPVIYPEPTSGMAAKLMKFNPVAPLLTTSRDWLLHGPLHDISGFILITAASFILFIIALFFYRMAMPILIERIGS